MAKERIVYYDILRGIAILAVITLHGTLLDTTSLELLIGKNAILFAVPLFLGMSGFFMSRKKINSVGDYKDFLNIQGARIAIPYIIWCVPYGIIKVINSEGSLFQILFQFLTFQLCFAFYYVALIVQYYLLLPVLLKFNNLRGLIISVIITFTTVVALLVLKIYYNLNPPLVLYAGFFPSWIMFFQLGLFLGKGYKLNIPNNLSYILIFLLLFIAVLESTIFQTYKFEGALSVFRIASLLYCFSVVYFLLSRIRISQLNNWGTVLLNKLGKYSFGIYLSHMLFLPLMEDLSRRTSSPLASQFLSIILTVLVCYMFAFTSERFLGSKAASKYLGF